MSTPTEPADEVHSGGLTPRQHAILTYIRDAVRDRGFPPSVREIGEAVGLSSTSSVHNQLAQLQQAGYLRRDQSRPRAIEVLPPPGEAAAEAAHAEGAQAAELAGVRRIPLVGEIAAGAPIIADEHIEQQVTLPEDLVGEGTLFMLRVRGESMVDDGILPDDLVVVRQQPTVEQGEMCAALIDGEATVKRFRRGRDGRLWLDPSNEAFEPIPLDPQADNQILGRVVAVLRTV
ncbi:transcriptional repressor LexA [Egibacter rhizosphaerae]|uniref:transcriptional repressor LexA n=1 Tax=Egibacter rhizosphaerae TaxID=1670831 RepID=UPI001F0FBEE5|nr:transcriptional repressor LexA [Egibacter rhizosphaerae]